MLSKHTVFYSTLAVMLLFFSSTTVSATEVWAEEFDSGLDDWHLYAYYWDNNNVWWSMDENWQIIDGALTPPDSDTLNVTHFANHASTTTHGTWSFDWTADDEGDSRDVFVFMMKDTITQYNFSGYKEADLRFEGYGLIIEASGNVILRLLEYLGNDAASFAKGLAAKNKYGLEISKHHFDITRTLDGNITVYLDQEKMLSVIDVSEHEAEKIAFGSWKGASFIDNITIDGEVLPIGEEQTPSDTDETHFLYYLTPPALWLLSIQRKKIRE